MTPHTHRWDPLRSIHYIQSWHLLLDDWSQTRGPTTKLSRLSSISPSTSTPRSEHLCLPPTIPVEILTPTGDGISSCDLWEVIRSWDGALLNGLSALIQEMSQKSLALSIMWGHNEKGPAMNQKEGPHPTMLLPSSWTSSLQSCELYIYVVYKPPIKHPHVVFCCSSPNGLRQQLLESWTYGTRSNKIKESCKWNQERLYSARSIYCRVQVVFVHILF